MECVKDSRKANKINSLQRKIKFMRSHIQLINTHSQKQKII